MGAVEVIEALDSLGVSITAQGTKLLLKPGSKVSTDVLEDLQEHKSEVLEYIVQRRTFRMPFPMGFGGLPKTLVLAAEGWNDAKGFIQALPELQATAIVKPAIHFLGIEPEWNGAEKLCRYRFALPVIGAAVAHLCGAARDRIKYLEWRYQVIGAVDFDIQATTTHAGDGLCQAICCGTQARKIQRPGGDHFPVQLCTAQSACGAITTLTLRTSSYGAGGGRSTGQSDKFSAIHIHTS